MIPRCYAHVFNGTLWITLPAGTIIKLIISEIKMFLITEYERIKDTIPESARVAFETYIHSNDRRVYCILRASIRSLLYKPYMNKIHNPEYFSKPIRKY